MYPIMMKPLPHPTPIHTHARAQAMQGPTFKHGKDVRAVLERARAASAYSVPCGGMMLEESGLHGKTAEHWWEVGC